MTQKWDVEHRKDRDAQGGVTKADATPKERRQRRWQKFDSDSERERDSRGGSPSPRERDGGQNKK